LFIQWNTDGKDICRSDIAILLASICQIRFICVPFFDLYI
jgi:hypothetical protein